MTTPEDVTELEKNEIFVFGSNYAGRHGRGAALTALKKFGAIPGQGSGLMGQSYGIPTKGHKLEVLGLDAIASSVYRFRCFACTRPDLRFLVTPIGCGLAGYTPKDIGPMFANMPGNVMLPKVFIPYS